MIWQDALRIVVEQTGGNRFVELCADQHPDHEYWRSDMVRRAKGEPPPVRQYPSIGQQVVNAAGAAGRVVRATVAGKQVLVSDEERDRRQAICDVCPEWDAQQRRCTKCGCGGIKLAFATESCPIGKWLATEPRS